MLRRLYRKIFEDANDDLRQGGSLLSGQFAHGARSEDVGDKADRLYLGADIVRKELSLRFECRARADLDLASGFSGLVRGILSLGVQLKEFEASRDAELCMRLDKVFVGLEKKDDGNGDLPENGERALARWHWLLALGGILCRWLRRRCGHIRGLCCLLGLGVTAW